MTNLAPIDREAIASAIAAQLDSYSNGSQGRFDVEAKKFLGIGNAARLVDQFVENGWVTKQPGDWNWVVSEVGFGDWLRTL